VEKGPDAFRTISEVAEDLDLPQHVLRFWETRFAQIKPMKRGGGRRYYRPDDVDLLRGIRHLLYGEGYTIRGVQQILKDQGLRYVQTVGRSAETDPARLRDIDFSQEALEQSSESMSASAGVGGGVVNFVPPSRPRPEPEMPRTLEPRVVETPRQHAPQPVSPPQAYEDDGPAIPFRRFAPVPDREEPRMPARAPQDEPVYEPRVQEEPAYEARVQHEPRIHEPRMQPEPRMHEPRVHPEERYEPRISEPQMRAHARAPMPEPPGTMRLSSEGVRLLKATLYELGECRRMLDASVRKGGA
jgi:DNA-binding transcriptional MerR regulator